MTLHAGGGESETRKFRPIDDRVRAADSASCPAEVLQVTGQRLDNARAIDNGQRSYARRVPGVTPGPRIVESRGGVSSAGRSRWVVQPLAGSERRRSVSHALSRARACLIARRRLQSVLAGALRTRTRSGRGLRDRDSVGAVMPTHGDLRRQHTGAAHLPNPARQQSLDPRPRGGIGQCWAGRARSVDMGHRLEGDRRRAGLRHRTFALDGRRRPLHARGTAGRWSRLRQLSGQRHRGLVLLQRRPFRVYLPLGRRRRSLHHDRPRSPIPARAPPTAIRTAQACRQHHPPQRSRRAPSLTAPLAG